jgi:ribosome-binding protein aMBF1 (putative translation factor)
MPRKKMTKPTRKRRRTSSDALEILLRRYVVGRPEQEGALEVARLNASIAEEIYDLRIKDGLTQKELADLIGTSHSVISRLEDADYAGHSLKMLQRISVALHHRLEVRFIPLEGKRKLTA